MHPFERWPVRRRKLWLLGLAIAFILTEIPLQKYSRRLITEQAKYGIASFQLAGSVNKSATVLESWDDNVRNDARTNLLIDFVFLVIYSTLFSALSIWATELHRQAQRSWIASLGLLIAWSQWVAAIWDAIENIMLLQLLRSEVRQPWPRIAQVSAIIKYLFVLAGIVYILLGGALYWLLLQLHPRQQTPVDIVSTSEPPLTDSSSPVKIRPRSIV